MVLPDTVPLEATGSRHGIDLQQNNGTTHPFIAALFFCKFDEHHGPKIVCCDPDGFLEQIHINFQQISRYFLPDIELHFQVISLCVGNWRIIGAPLTLEDSKYARNSFSFSFCIIIDKETSEDTFRAMVLQMAYSFCALEVETLQLSSAGFESTILEYLQQIRHSVNLHGKIYLRFNSSNALCLTLREHNYLSTCIPIDSVPLPLVDLSKWLTKRKNKRHHQAFSTFSSSTEISRLPLAADLTLVQILPYIDGLRSLASIAAVSHVDKGFLQICIQHLIYFKCVALIDMFDLSNRYRLTKLFPTLWKDVSFCEKLVIFCMGGASIVRRRQAENLPFLSLSDILHLYAHLTDPTTLAGKSLCEFKKEWECWLDTYNISLRHLVAFGIAHGFLQRVHEYPVYISSSNADERLSPPSSVHPPPFSPSLPLPLPSPSSLPPPSSASPSSSLFPPSVSSPSSSLLPPLSASSPSSSLLPPLSSSLFPPPSFSPSSSLPLPTSSSPSSPWPSTSVFPPSSLSPSSLPLSPSSPSLLAPPRSSPLPPSTLLSFSTPALRCAPPSTPLSTAPLLSHPPPSMPLPSASPAPSLQTRHVLPKDGDKPLASNLALNALPKSVDKKVIFESHRLGTTDSHSSPNILGEYGIAAHAPNPREFLAEGLHYCDGVHRLDWIVATYGFSKQETRLQLEINAKLEKKRIVWIYK